MKCLIFGLFFVVTCVNIAVWQDNIFVYASENAPTPQRVPDNMYATGDAGDKTAPRITVDSDKWLSQRILRRTGKAKIESVIDGETVLLDDKTVITIAGLKSDLNEQSIIKAYEHLKTLLPEGTDVGVYQHRDKGKRTNRMDRQIAHLVTGNDNWINGQMLADGYGIYWPLPDQTALQSEMRQLEQIAHLRDHGGWGENGHYMLLGTENADVIERGGLYMLEGKVRKVALVRNNLYLNFGSNWKTDFTVMIPPGMRKAFAKDGINLQDIQDERINVRGWVREYNGPFIELEDTAYLYFPDRLPVRKETPTLPDDGNAQINPQ